MAFWMMLAFWAVSFTVSQLLSPEPKGLARGPTGLNDFNFPTATPNRVIPKIWGRVKQCGPNVTWYGNYRVRRKTETVRVNMFNKKRVTVGYYYYAAMMMAICEGPVILKRIWIGDTVVWEGSESNPAAISIKGEGCKGTLWFHPGTASQSPNSFLQQHLTLCPAYRGLCYVVFDGLLGESTYINPWSFEVERIPNGLGLVTPEVNTCDSNPMNAAYEIIRDAWKYAESDVDLVGFQTAAKSLAAENNGWSLLLDRATKASELLGEIEQQINGHFYLDAATGKWKIELVRDNAYDPEELPRIDETNIKNIQSFTRSTWDGTFNDVRIVFCNRDEGYVNGAIASAQDIANAQIQGARHPKTISLPGVMSGPLASALAWRELRMLSFPLARARVTVDRSFWDAYIGKPYLFAVTSLVESSPISMRVTRAALGTATDGGIDLELVQDVFSVEDAAFTPPETTWQPPGKALVAFPQKLIEEAPYAVTRRSLNTDTRRIWAVAHETGKGEANFRLWLDDGSGYFVSDNESAISMRGELAADISATATTIDIVAPDLSYTDMVPSTSATEIGENLVNLILVDSELIAVTAVTDISGGVRLTGCYRGLCDTAQAAHTEGDPVWITSLGWGITGQSVVSANPDVKLQPYNGSEEVALGSIPATDVTMVDRHLRPYPPTQLALNGSQFPATVNIDSDVAVTFNRRDWRIYDEVSQLAVDAETLDPTFPAADTTQYQVILYDAGSAVYTGAWNAGLASLSVAVATIVRYMGGCPENLEIGVRTRHNATYESLQDLMHTATVTSVLLDDTYLGLLDTGQISDAWVAPTTGDYDFTLSAALDADLQVKINGGELQTVVTAGNLAGILVGIIESDMIEVRHADSTSTDEVLLVIDAPGTTTDAYAVLIFDDNYWQTGGFGRGEFGSDKFGR